MKIYIYVYNGRDVLLGNKISSVDFLMLHSDNAEKIEINLAFISVHVMSNYEQLSTNDLVYYGKVVGK